jgi:hypothetical protein
LSALKGAGLAVVITSVLDQATLEDRAILTGKLYEAIGAGKPVLAISPEGSDIETVLASGGFGERFSGREDEAVAGYIERVIEKRVSPIGSSAMFSWPHIVSGLDGVLRSVVFGTETGVDAVKRGLAAMPPPVPVGPGGEAR